MMHHLPKCEWVKAKRELCNCDVLISSHPDDPYARAAQLERELAALKQQVLKITNLPAPAAYALMEAARMHALVGKLTQELDNLRNIEDLL
jgi:hypothetical protein